MNTLYSLAFRLADAVNGDSLPHVTADKDRIGTIFDVFFTIIGSVCVLVLVIAGLRYVNSAGDPSTLSKVKRTIIYSGVGLVVTMSAFAMTTFIINNI